MLFVSAHPYCARKFTHYIMHESACLVITEQWKGRWPVLYMYLCLDLTILDIPIFPLMEHFLYQFFTLSENMTNLSTRNLNFLQNASLKSILFSSLFSVHNGFKCLFKGLSFVKILETFGIIQTTDPLVQNDYDCLPPLTHLKYL